MHFWYLKSKSIGNFFLVCLQAIIDDLGNSFKISLRVKYLKNVDVLLRRDCINSQLHLVADESLSVTISSMIFLNSKSTLNRWGMILSISSYGLIKDIISESKALSLVSRAMPSGSFRSFLAMLFLIASLTIFSY